MIIVCANCGKEFETREFGDGLCSDTCREATWIRRSNQQNRRKYGFLRPFLKKRPDKEVNGEQSS